MLHAEIDETTGPQLQRLIRQGSEANQQRAALLLESGLGGSVEELLERYPLSRMEIENLIVRFNALGTRALRIRKPPAPGLRYAMNETETAIVVEMIRLTPRAFGRPDDRWLAEELCEELRQRELVGYVDGKAIRALLDDARSPRANRANRATSSFTFRSRH